MSSKRTDINKFHLAAAIAALAGIWITLFGIAATFRLDFSEIVDSEYFIPVVVITTVFTVWFTSYLLNILGKIGISAPRGIKSVSNVFTGFFMIIFIISGIIFGFSGIYNTVTWNMLLSSDAKEPYLTWTADPSTTMTVTWETDTPVITELYLGKSPDNLTKVAYGSAPSVHHSVTLKNLEPFGVYYYRVSGFDNIYSFRTAALPNETSEVRFIVYGDNRYNNDRIVGLFGDYCAHSELVSLIAKNYMRGSGLDYNFTLNLGDVVWKGGYEHHWVKFHKEIVPLASNRPYMIAFGNHEYYGGDTQYTPDEAKHAHYHWEYNNASGNEFDYYFTLGNVLFIVFSSGEYGRVEPSTVEWINKTLAELSPKYEWIITANHHPLYSGGKARLNLTQSLEGIFEKYGVDIVLAGHTHNYQRTSYPDKNWTMIVSGGGGASLTSIDGYYNVNVSIEAFHYMEWSIKGNRAEARVIGLNGSVIDSFVLYSG